MDIISRLSAFFLVLTLASCAEMGSISGGPVDAKAPKVKKNGMNPPNASTHFDRKEIQIEFDEFVKLSNPTENITIQPDDLKVKAELKNKTVFLYLEGEFNTNTTYTITLNGAVQDITESNDSLMQYVFSTGAEIDSLSYQVKIVDAEKYVPKKDIIVGLYELKDSIFYQKPIYFTKTNTEGVAKFTYLKEGTYRTLAFQDMNRDQKWQAYENLGFKSDSLKLDSTTIDTIPIRFYTPKQVPKIRSKNFIAPSFVKLGANYNLQESEIFVGGKKIEKRTIYTPDSIGFFLPEVLENNEIIVHSAEHIDTVEIRILEKNKMAAPTMEIKNQVKTLYVKDTLKLFFSDQIKRLDKSRILAQANDSVFIPIKYLGFNDNCIQVMLDTNSFKKFKLNILDSSIFFQNYQGTFQVSSDFSLRRAEDLGDLVLKHQSNDSTFVYELKQSNKVIRTFKNLANEFSIKLLHLEAGDYVLEGFVDANGNGRWDIGNVALNLQPESRFFFSNAIKVRANWEIEVELITK